MAFKSCGYGNLPNGNFSPVIYSKQVQVAFRKAAVCEAITNNDYFGEIAQMGDSVKIIKEPEITVKAYARGAQITPQDLDDEDFTLTIDKANYYAFKVDDIEEAHSHVNFQSLLLTVQPIVLLTSLTKKFLVICQALSNQLSVLLLALLMTCKWV